MDGLVGKDGGMRNENERREKEENEISLFITVCSVTGTGKVSLMGGRSNQSMGKKEKETKRGIARGTREGQLAPFYSSHSYLSLNANFSA